MPSTFTTRVRLNKQATGENANVWGFVLNTQALDAIDAALDGVVTISAGGSTTLTTANGAADQARNRFINITATTAATITIPPLEKWYLVRNASSSVDHIITNGSSSVTVRSGEVVPVVTDGTSVWKFALRNMEGAKLTGLGAPTANTDAATKQYVDGVAFESIELPGQAGNAGKFVQTDGANASWETIEIADVDGLQAALGARESIADRATAAEFRADSADKHLATNDVWDAAEYVTVTYASTVALDFSTFFNARITLTGNITFNAPTNLKPGQTGFLKITQDPTGSRTASWNSAFKFVNSDKTLSTTANAVDYVSYHVVDSSTVLCVLMRNPG